MTLGGWILLSVSWGGVTALVVFCLVNLLRDGGSDSDPERKP